MLLEFLARLIGVHELMLLNFYPYITRLLQPHQREAVKILQCTAQSAHPLVPPSALQPVMRTLADHFITERNSAEVMAVGLNTVREICARCPLGIEDELLHYLITFKSHKDKGVAIAARSLMQLFRNIDPARLLKKHRGMATEARKDLEVLRYGETSKRDYIVASDIVATEAMEEEEEDDGWVDIPQSGDEDESDSEVEDTKQKPMSIEEKRDISRNVLESRFLTQEEFQKIDSEQIRRAALRVHTKSLYMPKPEDDIANEDRGELVKMKNIEMVYTKKPKDKNQEKEEESHGSRKGKHNEEKSKTNRMKEKQKNYMMLKPLIQKKKTRLSFQQRQVKMRDALIKAKRFMLK